VSARDHLSLAEVLAIHADQDERYGGAPGVRDWGLLDFEFRALVEWLRRYAART
jgi:hypothetical protein